MSNGASAARAAADVMRDERRALVVHTREELGVDPEDLPSPWRASASSLVCFIIGALLPVIPWFAGSGTSAIVASLAIGAVAAVALGWTIGRFAERRPAVAAFRQVAIMLGACVVTYSVGKALGVDAT
ncbi:MAG: VIT1/CCC1 transporter family protein [Actinobacteria bacterium]|nr:VIT1/CCC1 transporter family protein [Actinomycetota bacterium]